MNVTVKTAKFTAAPDVVFDFVSKIENLPLWATNYAKSVRKDGDTYYVETSMGEIIQEFVTNEEFGAVNMNAGPSRDQLWSWYIRIFSDLFGGSILNFTALQMPGQNDVDFTAQCAVLEEEFENIRTAIAS
ncbi:MAG: hypothetical protein COB54_06130 [Alphaproteobacteria bacterium]|nr:MAG: hypothetical protein COB54_06130 [Alphaproteobacteria bacterium]